MYFHGSTTFFAAKYVFSIKTLDNTLAKKKNTKISNVRTISFTTRFLTVLTKKMFVYWYVMPCSLVKVQRYLKWFCYQPPWQWRRKEILKRRQASTRLHGVTSQRKAISNHGPFQIFLFSVAQGPKSDRDHHAFAEIPTSHKIRYTAGRILLNKTKPAFTNKS